MPTKDALVPKKSQRKFQKKKVNKRRRANVSTLTRKPNPTTVFMIEHLPDNFTQEGLTKYLSEFGRVFGVYMPRSKSGKGRGYAFVKMTAGVSEVVMSTLHNKLMFNKIVKCKVISDLRRATFLEHIRQPAQKKLQKLSAPNLEPKENGQTRRRRKSLADRVAEIKKTAPEFAADKLLK